MTVDDAGWEEVAKVMDEAQERLMAIHSRSSKRLAGEEGMPIIVGLAAFEAGRRAAAGD